MLCARVGLLDPVQKGHCAAVHKTSGRFLLAGQEAAAAACLTPLGVLYCTQPSKKHYDYKSVYVCCPELC